MTTPFDLRGYLRQLVYNQDERKPIVQDLQAAKFSQNFINCLMLEVFAERARMVREGLNIRAATQDADGNMRYSGDDNSGTMFKK